MSIDNKKGEITINDIAKALNIAASTVSRALNDSAKISEKTKQKVRVAAQEMGYELNLVASSLSKNKTNLIGVILPKLSSQFFAKALSGIEEVAQAAGYKIIICQTNESYQQEVEMTKVMNSARVDGVIACLAMETQKVDHFGVFLRKDVPVAMFDRVNFNVPGPKVVVDNYEGAFKATEHLINVGCNRIAHLGGPQSCKVFVDRANGFKEALKTHNLPLLPQLLLASDLNEKDARDAMQIWMGLDKKPDAILTASATTGLIITSIAKKYGVKIPDDLSIISFGNEPCNEFMVPSLSAVDMPGYDMGKEVASHLIQCIETKSKESPLVLKPIQLLIRNSSFVVR